LLAQNLAKKLGEIEDTEKKLHAKINGKNVRITEVYIGRFDEWGNEDPDGDGTNFVFDMRFPGQRYDAASGLNYNYFRDYEPGTGRYSQSDPIGFYASISTYAYVDSNPIYYYDSMGLVSNRNGGVIKCGLIKRMLKRSAANKAADKLICPDPDDEDCIIICNCKHKIRMATCMANPHCLENSRRKLYACLEVCSTTGIYPRDPNDENPYAE
jgi:RHS repeat-associated protein